MRQFVGSVALVVGLIVLGMDGAPAFAESKQRDSPAALIGVAAYSADGREVGTVSAVTVKADGTVTEIRVTTSSPLGLGERTVTIDEGNYSVLEGAVVLDFSASEVDALPTSRPAPRQTTPA